MLRKRHVALAAVGSLPLLGVIAAFGIAPQTVPEPVPVQQVVREIALTPALAKPDVTDEVYWREERVQRGDTIASLLARLQVSDRAAVEYLRTSRDVRLLRQLVPGRTVRATTGDDGTLMSLRYLGTDGIELQVERKGDRFTTREQAPDGDVQLLMTSGEISSSLFAATDAAGLSDPVAVQLAEIFSSEIDFHRDLRPGDRFSVVYEGVFSAGELVRTGRILGAEFSNQGRVLRAIYFQARDGRGGYYAPDGRSMRKVFLRSPLEISRVSSGFSLARFHPILQTWRAHKGVDYAAPVGARVRATGDGYVQFRGQQGGYGNVIILRHGNGYSTLYGHLSGFARGAGVGQRVNQGDVIGFVGMSGLATGPHLHYEFRLRDVHQNPLKLAAPDAPPLAAEARARFQQVARPVLDRLELMRDTRLTLAN
ncbi:MAG TPA: M23 family metallopeptidase [Steroidobacteraceae bacterium]|nr:M23 family metallopeptidase [Steroidobacteraceae bacterium]